MTLLLNIAAGYSSLTQVISGDGATISQAITCCDNLIDNPTGNHNRAMTIAAQINDGLLLPAGLIPANTLNISYARQGPAVKFHVTPNPGRGNQQFQFTLRHAGHVELRVFDVAGRVVAKLVDAQMAPGPHVVSLGWAAIHPTCTRERRILRQVADWR